MVELNCQCEFCTCMVGTERGDDRTIDEQLDVCCEEMKLYCEETRAAFKDCHNFDLSEVSDEVTIKRLDEFEDEPINRGWRLRPDKPKTTTYEEED